MVIGSNYYCYKGGGSYMAYIEKLSIALTPEMAGLRSLWLVGQESGAGRLADISAIKGEERQRLLFQDAVRRFRDSKPPPHSRLWWIAYRRIHHTGSDCGSLCSHNLTLFVRLGCNLNHGLRISAHPALVYPY